MKGVKLRLTRTLVAVFGGLVLIGGSGAAALLFGAGSLLGPSYEEVNGLECTTMQLVKIKRDQHYWVRKYVFTEGGDGMSRMKTALRVAKAVEGAEKADLVQVTVLDKSGPTQRAAMRGRAIGAQVVYIPDASKAPSATDARYAAFYVEGQPSKNGEFYGLRIDLPLEDVEKVSASLTDTADCISPVVQGPDGHGGTAAKGGDHAKPGKGSGKDHGAPAHGEAPAHGSGGEAPAGDGHGEASDGKDTPDAHAPEGEAGDTGGLLSSIKGMIFGAEPEAVAAAASHAPSGTTDHAEGDAVDHDTPSVEHTAVAEPPGMIDRLKALVFGDDAERINSGEAPVLVALPQAEHQAEVNGKQPPHDGIDPMKVAAPTDTGSAHAGETAEEPSHEGAVPFAPKPLSR